MASDHEDRWERWVRQVLRGEHLKEPPTTALRKAVALSGRLPEDSGGWLAGLLFDSAAQPLPAGVRGSAAGTRRLLYETASGGAESGPYQLDLRVRREAEGTIEITGQLLPPWPRARVLARGQRLRREKKLGQSGEFVFRGLPGSLRPLRLEIRNEDGERIVLPELSLDPSGSEKP